MKTILCPTDFSASSRKAVESAWELARKSKGTLIILHVYYVPEVIPYGDLPHSPGAASEKAGALQDQLDTLQAQVLQTYPDEAAAIQTEIRYGVPVNQIVALANEQKVDLIVMSTQGADGLLERMIGTRASDVAEETVCPVLVIPAGYTPRPVQRIVYATDCQGDELPGVNAVLQLAEQFDAEVSFLHILEKKESKTEISQTMNEIYKALTYENVSFYNQQFDDAYEGITQFAREHQADWLVMATHKRTFMQRIFSPSLTRKVAFNTGIPLLVLHK
jgi:nucleotide-binding universal stress UspA family protein